MNTLIKKFFWICSGATVSLLEECETEHNKYVGIGATVLMTGILAGLSAGYALYTVFWSWEWAAAFGTLWGLMIFNLDRFIILSIKKNEADPSWDWRRKVREKARETFAMLPRLGLAVLLALIITKPLELKLFEKEVEQEMAAMKREEEGRVQASLNSPDPTSQAGQIAAQIDALKKENDSLRQQIEARKAQWNAAQDAANCECLGTCGSRERGVGPNCKTERNRAELLMNDYLAANKPESEFNRRIGENLKQVENLEQVRAKLASEARQTTDEARGLATRLSAFDRLTARDKVYGAANLAIMLIFILLETAPILAKLFSAYGPYDKSMEVRELRDSVAQMKEQIGLVDGLIKAQESSERHRKAMLTMQENMLAELESETEHSREFSGQVQAEWNQAKREFVRQAISGLRRQTSGTQSNGTH